MAAAAGARHRSTSHNGKEVITMKLTQNLGMLLLAIWLILTGLLAFVPALGGIGIILSVLAIIAGILILIGR
jgi:hypothetical protein